MKQDRTSKLHVRPALVVLALAAAGLLAGCATPLTGMPHDAPPVDTDPIAELRQLGEAVVAEPRNADLRARYLARRDALATGWLNEAERARAFAQFEQAERLYREVLSIEPANARARTGLDTLIDERRRLQRLDQAEAAYARGDSANAERLVRSVLAESPANTRARRLLRELDERRLLQPPVAALAGPLAKKVNLQFRDAPLRVVFEALSRAAGLNFVFDSDVRDDALVSIFVRDTSVDEVIKLLTATQQIDRKLLNANSVLIYPATPAKQREYQELVSRSFYLANADVKQALNLIKQVVKSRDVFIDEKLNLLVIKDTPEAMRLAERLIASLDVAEPEVMLEVEVLEVSRTKLRQIGLEFPQEIGWGAIDGQNVGPLQDGVVNLNNTGGLVPFVSNPAAVLRLRAEDGDTTLLANPRIRVKNRAEAKVHIGEKVPVFTTTSTANVGVAASVSYLDVGLKLDVVPSVTLDDEVAIKVALEVSNIVREVPGPEGSLAYQIGTRSAATTLRLKHGETQVLAGLINDEERGSNRRLPGLGDLPVVGRLFSSERDQAARTEIVLLITPRVVRNIVAPAFTRDDLAAGTEALVGAAPLRIGPMAPESLLVSGTGQPGAAAAAATVAARPLLPSGEAEIDPGSVVVDLAAPESAVAGGMLTLSLKLDGAGGHNGVLVEFDYDAERLEPVGFAPSESGQASTALPAGNLPTAVPIGFKVKEGATGTANVRLNGLIFDLGGRQVPIPASGAAAVQLQAQ